MSFLSLSEHLTNSVLTEILMVSFSGGGQMPMKTDLEDFCLWLEDQEKTLKTMGYLYCST